MDFFEHQEIAKRRTSRLVFFYFLAVALIILSVYFAVVFIFTYGAKYAEIHRSQQLWDPMMFLYVAACTGAIIFIGTLYKIHVLSAGGGQAVAEMLGGQPVEPGNTDPGTRRLLNVVEEMAIASGTPVPRVYILEDDEGINAFAAGFTRSDAVIGVTRGCVNNLTRDQLQGVIAHEFSHILNGDMRLNIRLMGVLNGILIIALIGYWIVRSMSRSGRGSSRGKKGGAGAALAIFLFGIALLVIGYIGVFFGKLIKSAVSRQREFLADASSVQFTRNPDGITGALKRIMALSAGSVVSSSSAEEASHFFFANGLRGSWFSMMATHPPLDERIRRIDPSFTGTVEPIIQQPEPEEDVQALKSAAFAAAAQKRGTPPPIPYGRTSFAIRPSQIMDQVGTPTSGHIEYAANLVASLPPEIPAMLREPTSAQALVYAVLISTEADVRQKQIAYIAGHADARVHASTLYALPLVAQVSASSRIPVVDLALPALRQINATQYEEFRGNMLYLVSADMQIDIFEYALMHILVRNLDPVFKEVKRPRTKYKDVSQVQDNCVTVLSTLARFGNEDEPDAAVAFTAGLRDLSPESQATILPAAQCSLEEMDKALEVLVMASPALKKQVVGACAACIASDGKTTLEEAELLRAIADSLDCPIPPFIQAIAA